MIRRQLSLLVALALLAVLAVPAVATPQGEKAAAPTTITLWTGYSERLPVYKAAAADYSKDHPNVTIEIANFDLRQSEQKLQIALSSGTAPDLSGLGFQLMQRLSSQDYLDTLPGKHVSWLKDSYEQAYLDAVTRDGKIYGIPEVQGFQLLFYNLDDYDAAGLTKPAGTLDELMANARKLTKYDANGKVTHSGVSLRLSGGGSGVAEKWDIFLFGYGMRAMQPTGAHTYKAGYNNDAGYNAVNFYLDALYKSKVDSIDVKHDEEAFVGGITSQFNRETYIIGSMRNRAPKTRYGIAQVAAGPGGRATNLNVDTWVVPSVGKNKETAWDVARYFEQDKYCVMMMKDVGWIVSKKGVDYSSVYAQEPHFQQALSRPQGFQLMLSPAAVSWAEVYTTLASGLVTAYADPSLLDNKAKIMGFLADQAQKTDKILQTNKEYAP